MSAIYDPAFPRLPLRPDCSDADAPAVAENFCDCIRGIESKRWWSQGCIIPSSLAEHLGHCGQCNASTGVRWYWGYLMANDGAMVGVDPFSPPLERTPHSAEPAITIDYIPIRASS